MLVTATILSTKKLSWSQKNHLLSANLSVIEADYISIKYCAIQLENTPELLLFTSKNAVKAVCHQTEIKDIVKNIPCLCVGAKTKELAESKGFKVLAYEHYATDLLSHLSEYKELNIAFFAGSIRRNTIPNFLKENQISYQEYTVYTTQKTPQKINSSYEGILFFSPSAVESFLQVNTLEQQKCFCIGTTTAEALKPYTNQIICAKTPTIENTIIRAIEYFKNKK